MTDHRHRDGAAASASGSAAIDYGPLSGLLGYHLRRAQARVFADFMRAAADVAVTPGQFGVLALIDANPGISQSALAKALGIERSTMVAVIDRLERQNLLARGAQPGDRRSHALRLTDDGLALLARLVPAVRRHEQRIAAGLGADEVRTLIALLKRVAPR